MYSSVLKKWRAREAEDAKLLRPADTLTRSLGPKHSCSLQLAIHMDSRSLSYGWL